jgi:hypothetical protein
VSVNTELTEKIRWLQQQLLQSPAAARAAERTVPPPTEQQEPTTTTTTSAATLSNEEEMELVSNIVNMSMAVEARMESTLELYERECKQPDKESMVQNYVKEGNVFIQRIHEFDPKSTTIADMLQIHTELDKKFREFEQLDIRVRKDMCRREMGTMTTDTAGVALPALLVTSAADVKEIAIPQLNYEYNFTCNGKTAPQHMIEWMKREPHYANEDKDDTCIIVDKSLFCIAGSASGEVFKAGQKLANEFEVFLVDGATGWACIGRKRCTSMWDRIKSFGTNIGAAMFEAAKMAIQSALKLLNFLLDKAIKLGEFGGNIFTQAVYAALDVGKHASKKLFTLQFTAFVMLVAGVVTFAPAALPALGDALGISPFFQVAAVANNGAALLQHADALPLLALAVTEKSMAGAIAQQHAPAANAMLRTVLLGVSQLPVMVPLFQYTADKLGIQPEFTAEQTNQFKNTLATIETALRQESARPPPPFLPPPRPSDAEMSSLVSKFFRGATQDTGVIPMENPQTIFGWVKGSYDYVYDKVGADNSKLLIAFANAGLLAYIAFRLWGGDWEALVSLGDFLPKFPPSFGAMALSGVAGVVSNNPTVQSALTSAITAAATNSPAARLAFELQSSLGPYWAPILEGTTRLLLKS